MKTISWPIFCLLCLLLSPHQGQAIDIAGRVFDEFGFSIQNAVVTLVNAAMVDSTDSAGMFKFGGSETINQLSTEKSNFSIRSDLLTLRLTHGGAPVLIELFDAAGRLVNFINAGQLSAGTWRMRIAGERPLHTAYCVMRLSIGNNRTCVPVLIARHATISRCTAARRPVAVGVEKDKATIVDSLIVRKDGFVPYRIALEQYTRTDLQIRLSKILSLFSATPDSTPFLFEQNIESWNWLLFRIRAAKTAFAGKLVLSCLSPEMADTLLSCGDARNLSQSIKSEVLRCLNGEIADIGFLNASNPYYYQYTDIERYKYASLYEMEVFQDDHGAPAIIPLSAGQQRALQWYNSLLLAEQVYPKIIAKKYHTIEFEFSLMAIERYLIKRDRLPPSPYDFSMPESLIAFINDRYTRYIPASRSEAFKTSLTTRTSFIGTAVDSTDSGFAVIFVIDGSPAQKAGLAAGDILVTVNGAPTAAMTTDVLFDSLYMATGDTMRLSVNRNGQNMDFEITMAAYYTRSVYCDSIDSTTAFIGINMFAESTSVTGGTMREFSNALDSTAWAAFTILDLRGNGGGFLYQCFDIAGHFVPLSTPIITAKNRVWNATDRRFYTVDTTYFSNTHADATSRRFCVLVDSFTASASEVLVSCLRDQRPDIRIIGTRTFGKGSGWVSLDTPDSALITVTSMLLYPIKGQVYDAVGIVPDILCDSTRNPWAVALTIAHGGGIAKRAARQAQYADPRLFFGKREWMDACIVDIQNAK